MFYLSSLKYPIQLLLIAISIFQLQTSNMPQESTNTHPKSDLLTIPPSKKFLSNSLPNSTTSSTRFASKKKSENQPSHLARQHSVALANLQRLKEDHLRRSKSCGEGRTTAPPPDKHHVVLTKVMNDSSTTVDKAESMDQKFKCGAMCLFIPGLGKAKQVRARRVEVATEIAHDVSRKVSLEKFECGSWTSSSAIIKDEEESENDESNLFFDLPIELIQYSDDKDMTCSPVTAGFVFDKEPKGVLKNNTKTKSSESTTRHVRFSTSSPNPDPDSGSSMSCMTPRMHKAREDFSALLEAQCA